MRSHRWIELEGGGRALEIDVTWEEFETIAAGVGSGIVGQSLVAERARRLFDPQTAVLVERYISDHPGKVPQFKPAKVVADVRPTLRVVDGGR